MTQLHVPEAPLVTDAGLQALAALDAMQDLDLSCWRPQADQPVSDAGMRHLAGLTALTRLSLAGRASITESGVLGGFTGLKSL